MKSFSQAGQDLFAWDVSGRKSDGKFLDIGCNDPIFHNNTYGLELEGWKGISVDIEKFDYSIRKTPFVNRDARQIINEVEYFMKHQGGRIDYLSIDADDATWDALTRLVPFHKFSALTVEHDKYRVGPEMQHRIHDFLKTFGYQRKFLDVCAPIADGQPWSGQPFEDWYILP